jgi:phage shock protein PspC (stress-responsive transcriptional regulator)
MNEVKKIHLGRQQFTISVEAHKDLHNYLAAIEKQPGVQAEVSKEVEMRMAELLHERGVSGDKVVLQEDVDFLKQQLGEPRDFKDEASEDTATDSKEESKDKKDKEAALDGDQPKRLFRDTQTGLVAGVASGLAAYTGIQVVIIRLIFVALTFASGAGILLYAIIWLLAPEARTPSERLQMQGKAVTVDTLKEMVDRADFAGAGERASRNFGYVVNRILESIFKVILWIAGSAFVAAGIITMLWTVATCVYLLIHGGQIGTDIAFPLGSHEVWFVVLGLISGAIFGFFLLMIGLAMISRKWLLRSWALAALLGVFLVSGGVGTALGFETVPNVRNRFRTAHHSQTRDVGEFNKLTLSGQDTNFRFVPDSKYFVELSYLGNVDTKPLLTTVESKTLTINSDGFVKTPLCNGLCFYSDHDLVVTVHAPSLESVYIGGQENSFNVDDQLKQTDLALTVRRGSQSATYLKHLQASVVKIVDDNSKDWTLQLAGIKNDAVVDSEVSLSDANNVIHVEPVDSLELTTTNSCNIDDPLVYLTGTPREAVVNGKSIIDPTFPHSLRQPGGQSVDNCVTLH